MNKKIVPSKTAKRWETILDRPMCFSDWNCLTASYKYVDGEENFGNCKWRNECSREHKRRTLKVKP